MIGNAEVWAKFGWTFPECGYKAEKVCDRVDGHSVWNVTFERDGRELHLSLVVHTEDGTPTREDLLHRLLYHESNHATLYLRDFVAMWADKSFAGRQDAIREWKRLRRQRVKLKAFFGDACP